jgi:phage shock protein A
MEDLLQEEVVKLEEELTKLKSAIEYIESAKFSIEAASKIINTISKLKEEFENLSEKAYRILEKIDKIDFPARFDKIDANISSSNQKITESLAKIESNERVVRDELKSLSKTLLGEMHDNSNNISAHFTNQSKGIKTIQVGVILIVVLMVIFGVVSFLKII